MVMIVMGYWVHFLMQMKKRVNRILKIIKDQYPDLCQCNKTKKN